MTQQGGYSPKDLHFGKEARGKLFSGIQKLFKAVSSTLGPLAVSYTHLRAHET